MFKIENGLNIRKDSNIIFCDSPAVEFLMVPPGEGVVNIPSKEAIGVLKSHIGFFH